MVDIELHGIPRRALLGGSALVALAGLTGCSLLPLGGSGDDLPKMLSRIGSDAVTYKHAAGTLEITWGRPAAAAEVLGLDPDAQFDRGAGPEHWIGSMLRCLPQPVVGADFAAEFPEGAGVDVEALWGRNWLVGLASGLAVRRGSELEVVLWPDEATWLDELHEALNGVFVREGELLRRREDLDFHGAWDTRVIGPVGEDLVFTTEDSLEGIDAEDTVDQLFDDLAGLWSAADPGEAHLATAVRAGHPGHEVTDGDVSELLWATRFDSAEKHTTRGVLRALEDPNALAARWEQDNPDIPVESIDVEDDLVIISLVGEPKKNEDTFAWQLLPRLHQHAAQL